MWHLKKVTSATLESYTGQILHLIKNRIEKKRNLPEYRAWCDYLLPDNGDDMLLKSILTSEPQRLFDLNEKVVNDMLGLYPEGNRITYDEQQLIQYIAEKRRDVGQANQTIINKYEPLFIFLLEMFDYGIIKGKKAYEIAMMKQVNTCTYCNRQYTLTIGMRKRANGGKVSKVKPQFDHWFAHEQYPLLGLSFYNLIPSCSVCNSSVKGSAHFTLETHIHPYISPDSNPDFKFRPVLKYDDELKRVRWGVMMKRVPDSKEDHTINDLFLEEIYDKHGELEVKDIMDFATKNNPTYLKSLFNHVCAELSQDYTQADVYRMLFGVDADIERTLERPFSKLKRDVLEGEGIIV